MSARLRHRYDPVIYAHAYLNEILDGDSLFLAAQVGLVSEALPVDLTRNNVGTVR
jgi:hypothetical protein